MTFVHHTAGDWVCFDKETCIAMVQSIQDLHMDVNGELYLQRPSLEDHMLTGVLTSRIKPIAGTANDLVRDKVALTVGSGR
jgi:hypothetical protein